MKRVKGKVDYAGWELEALDDLEDFIGETYLEDTRFRQKVRNLAHKAASESLTYLFQDDYAYIYFPIEWNFGENRCDGRGGEPVDDPLVLHLAIGENKTDPTFSFSLSEVIDELIEGGASGDTQKIEGEHAENAQRVSAGLKMLAQRIDGAMV